MDIKMSKQKHHPAAGNNEELEQYLYDSLQVSPNPREEKLQETAQACITQMHRRPSCHEPRTGFWEYLSDIFRFEGMSILGLQMIALLISCLGISTIRRIPVELPTFMPLFGLAAIPVLYRSQAHGMCEMEAATRASGAQIILAKLILTGAANLLCMTVVLCLEIFVTGTSDGIVQLILYAVVPFLVCMVEMLRCIRMCRRRGMVLYAAFSFGSCVGWGISAQVFPWLYETSATGVWVGGFVVFLVFYMREISYIIRMQKEGKMYGTVA